MNDIKRLKHDAICVRRLILDLAFKAGGGQHLGGGLSMVELMCALYGSVLNLTLKLLSHLQEIGLFFQGSRCSWFLPCTLVLRLHQ